MFKKMFGLMIATVMAFSLAACGQQTQTENSVSSAPLESSDSSMVQASASSGSETSSVPENKNPVSEENGTLVVYFSWSGNTEEMASYIADQTGGDLLEIQPETPYPTDYNECGDVAKVERDNNERPNIANLPKSIDQYDTILVGYPKIQYGFLSV